MSSTDQSSGQTNSARTEESSTTTSGENKVEISKYALRKQVWTHFEKNGLVSFPRPVRGRIPNFHGAPQAAAKLAELDVFKNATFIKVNADKPQENVRILTLEKEKKLLVPAPRTKEAIFMRVIPASCGAADLKKATSRRGMLEWGNLIELGNDIKIDLVVLGSVAVSREGHRIGKGEGFGDLEFSILVEAGAITKDTVVVTTVHDSQVFETLPQSLFKEYDVPVDIIVTPTEVIYVAKKLPKPKGVFWNILSQRKMNLMAVLKVLRNREIAKGKVCHLKEEDTDSETERTRRRLHQVRGFIRYTMKRSSAKSETEKAGGIIKAGTVEKIKEKKKQTRRFNRRFLKRAIDRNEDNSENVLKDSQQPLKVPAGDKIGETSDSNYKIRRQQRTRRNNPRNPDDNSEPIMFQRVNFLFGMPDIRKQKKLDPRRRRFPRNAPIQFSLRIGNITSNVRVRDLKNALAERNVKPTDITWRGHKGFAFIHFAKPKKESESPIVVDNIVASLRDMRIGSGDDGVTLLVELTKPITRIESTGITAV